MKRGGLITMLIGFLLLFFAIKLFKLSVVSGILGLCATVLFIPLLKINFLLRIILGGIILFGAYSAIPDEIRNDISKRVEEKNKSNQTPKNNKLELSINHNKILDEFKSDKEPTSKDAIWTAKDMLKVGVIDDGKNRNGYAEYICQTLYKNGLKNQKIRVQIVDIVKLSKNGDWVKLGEAQCI